MASKLCIVTCENIGRELAEVLSGEQFARVSMATFPAQCNHPRAGWHSLDDAVSQCAGEDTQVRVLGGCCVSGFGDPPSDMKFCRLHGADHCFHLFASRDLIAGYVRAGAYVVTQGWLERWRGYLLEFGFDQPTAQEFFQESTSKTVLLDTGVRPEAREDLQQFADYLGLPYEVVPVGLDFFRLVVTDIVLRWRLENERDTSMDALSTASKQSADCMIAFDLMGDITAITTEETAMENILRLFTMLFAPGKLVYVPVVDGELGKAVSCPVLPSACEGARERLASFQGQHGWTESERGFVLRVEHQGESQAIIEVDDIAFPEFKEHYLNLALSLARVCGLAISNARTYKRLAEATDSLRRQEERSRHISNVLQEAMIPEVGLDLPGYSVVGHYKPAWEEAEVGGDFYDVYEQDDGRLAVVVGDVSGKGLTAAVHTAMAKYMLRAFASEDPSPASVMRRLNDAISGHLPMGFFVTLFYGILDPRTGAFTYADAGHDQPLLRIARLGRIVELEVTGAALGFGAGSEYGEREVSLSPGDTLVIYTDGISEARVGDRHFGADGIAEVLAGKPAPPDEIVQAIFAAATRAAGGKLHDDAAVLVIHATGK